MKVGDLVESRQCIWHFSSEAKVKRIGIILNIETTPHGLFYGCWFTSIGYVEIDAHGIEIVEGAC